VFFSRRSDTSLRLFAAAVHAMMPLLAILASAIVTMAVLYGWLLRGAGMPLDVANGRSLHAGAVPRIGGVAMAAGCGVALLVMRVPDAPIVALLAALGLFLLSLVDDWRSLSVLPRLLGHLAAAVVAVAALQLPVLVAVPVAVALVWMTNLYNFMDGTDGLAGGMTVIGFGTYAMAALPQAPNIGWVSLAVAAAAAGFLVFNFPPARVFMGDAGSIPLGFLGGAFGLEGWQAGIWPGWFPLLVFSPFIADATVTLWRRLRRGERVWQAHREHYYQRLVLTGWSHRTLTLLAWGLMVVAAGSALWIKGLPAGLQGLGLLVGGLSYAGVFFLIDRHWHKATNEASAQPNRSTSNQ
jgi:UDP-N-acetylmuramyl pentapeptide phosphotransferase/UDP-N-acetylglucosamine-1-phosphate transferase